MASTKLTRQNTEVSPTDIYLPYRTLSPNANFDEYTLETRHGQILDTVLSHATGKVETHTLVTFKINDLENPKNWSKAYKWYCTMVVAFTCFVVAFNSSVVTADIAGVAEQFQVSDEVSLLSVTLFVVGFGLGTDSVDQMDWRQQEADLRSIQAPWCSLP